jgi:hypothetical protein
LQIEQGKTMTAIEQLVEGFPDNSGYCQQCEDNGACRDWVICMADDTGVPTEWLAQQVLDETVNSNTSVVDVQTMWQETRCR